MAVLGADGDPVPLTEEQKAEMKAKFEARKAEMKAKFMEKFDANKDGQLDDAEKADAVFTKLMGDQVDLRKNFIQAGAASVNLDDLDF